MKHFSGRSIFILAILGILGATILGRLFFLLVVNHAFYLALAQLHSQLSSISTGERGSIFAQDKQGNTYLLATNQKVPFLFISPPEIKDAETVAQTLYDILQIPKEEITKKFETEDTFHVVVKKDLLYQEETAIKEKKLAGVYIGYETKRYYPQGAFASHVLGFTNRDGKGQYGVEAYYDKDLRGKEGIKTETKNPAAYLFSLFNDTVQDGSDLILTLDYNVQSVAESLLEKARTSLNIEQGTIIVMEAKTGKIRALAGAPEFDPNDFSQVQDIVVFQNDALQKTYEPGSVFKPLTMAAAIDAGKVTPATTYEDTGSLTIRDRTVSNYAQRIWGQRTMTEVLEFSINTGAVFAQQQLGNRQFLEYMEQFGLFAPTAIDLAGEVHSKNNELKKGYEINFATAAFGQGIEVTPIQLVRAFTAFTNNGTLVQPFIAEKAILPQGFAASLAPNQKHPISVLSPKSAGQINSMLTSVVENGYGKAAQIPGYHVAGKTGTAQVSWSALGIPQSGYSNQTIQSFVGFAPSLNPEFIVLVKLDNPAAKTAEYSALPIFRELMLYILHYYEIPPDKQE